MVPRDLPTELVAALRRARDVEQVAFDAGGRRQQRQAVAGPAAIMLAAVEAGWKQTEIAAAAGIQRQAVAKRLKTARSRYGDQVPALLLDAPLEAPDPLAILKRPVEQRQWLTPKEAATSAGCHEFTIRNWLQAGLLPNTQTARRRRLILRADLERVVKGPRYNAHGVSYAAMSADLANQAR